MKRARILLGILLVLVGAGGIAYWRLTLPPSDAVQVMADAVPVPVVTDPAKPETEEDKLRQKLLGTWTDEYRGKRKMTLTADGKGTMHVELSGFDAVFGSKLRFDMVWTVEGKTLTKKTVGGEPAAGVNAILNLMGNTAKETVVELTEDRLLLEDKDRKYDWKRAKPTEPAKTDEKSK